MSAPDAAPFPPRYRWLKRLLPLAILFVLAAVALRVAWGHRWSTRLADAEAAVRAKGEPLRIAELKIDRVPDAENRAYYLQQALLQWPRIDGQLPGNVDAPYDEDPPEIIHDNAAYLASCEPVFDLLREAATKERCDWGTQYVSPAIYINPTYYGSLRELTRAVTDAVERAHAVGDDRLGFELLSLLPAVSEAADLEAGFTIGHLVGISIQAAALAAIQDVAPSLRIDADDPRAASPTQVRALIDALLDDDRLRERRVRAAVLERLAIHDNAVAMLEGNLGVPALGVRGAGPTGIFVGPLLRRDVYFMLAWNTAHLHAMRTATSHQEHGDLLRKDGPDYDAWEESSPLLRPLSVILLPAWELANRIGYQILARHRLAAVALAIRLYETEHGRRPATLDELVPRYLDAIPAEPYTLRAAPMRYSPHGGTLHKQTAPDEPVRDDAGSSFRPAVVYFDGPDGQDDGGRFVLNHKGRFDSPLYNTEDPLDDCFLLDPLPLPGPHHQPTPQHEPGQ